jgi:hypothetical protein
MILVDIAAADATVGAYANTRYTLVLPPPVDLLRLPALLDIFIRELFGVLDAILESANRYRQSPLHSCTLALLHSCTPALLHVHTGT